MSAASEPAEPADAAGPADPWSADVPGAGAVVLRGRLVLPERVVPDGVVVVEGETITFVGSTEEHLARQRDESGPGLPPDLAGTILPGLVDLHCHGGGGATVTTDDARQAARVAAHHQACGTTSMLASLVTASPDVLVAQVAALAPLVSADDLAGLHLEGPFLSDRRCGAQAPQHLTAPDVLLVDRLLDAAEGSLRVMTLAPELPGAAEVVAVLRAAGVVVALGHSDADHDTFARALDALEGTGLVTHLANGMPPLHHRAPGPVGAALTAAARGQATVEVIADGVHVDDAFAELVFATSAPGHVALVTDAMAAAGMHDGEYDLGPQRVLVQDGVARLRGAAASPQPAGRAAIAGGTAHLLDVVRRVASTSVGLVDAVRAASATPARVLGVADRVGSLTAGTCADLLVVDDALQLQQVMRHGRWLAS